MRDPLSAIDKIIADAQEEGKFEDLPGKGKPLVIDTSPDAVIRGVLKEANIVWAPEWIRLASEIDELLAEIERVLESYAGEYAAERAALPASPAPAATAALPQRATTRVAPTAPRRPRWWYLIAARFAGPPSPALADRMRDAQAVAAFQRRWDRALERYASLLHVGNRKIRRFNRVVPLANRQRGLLLVQERLEAFVERFPRPERAEDGSLRFIRGTIPAALLAPPSEDQDAAGRSRDVLQSVALQRLRQGGRRPPPIG